MAKLMGRIRISFNICQITFKTRIGLKHMKRGGGVKDGFERVFVLLLDGISVERPSTQEREGSPL